ncbi:hypothetical protein [Cyanobium sp. LEGE 06113]|uniref:hypothetical protein n=1 Tax=Cyanobium sp. LEGE 06113 TaxID=1297573 RepID=UPI001881026B|nr:hypothetical protein [Cyanobium sp. LEGE 06113]MBE9152866.1 hypothetical protein [Cyanobium sp. LEGE 06113]MBE9152929.1 hypothetical protein [Cyanobium sp. LEGE 06113]
MKLAAKIVTWLIALFYSYGAAVHVFNILGVSGFDWSAAPLKWQVLDILYLVIDLLVFVGLVLGWKIGFAAFYVAAISQIFLYTVFRDWIVDVPAGFTVSEAQQGYLTALVIFHCMTVILFTSALWIRSKPVQ